MIDNGVLGGQVLIIIHIIPLVGLERAGAVALGNEVFDKFLNHRRQEVPLERCNTLRRMGGYKVDTNNTTMRSSAIDGYLQDGHVNLLIVAGITHGTSRGYNDTTYL